MPTSIHDTFARLVTRDNRRTEAEIQADVRQFILDAPFELEEDDLSLVQLESQLGDRRRIDVEVGATVIEVKRDLRSERIRREAEQRSRFLSILVIPSSGGNSRAIFGALVISQSKLMTNASWSPPNSDFLMRFSTMQLGLMNWSTSWLTEPQTAVPARQYRH
ncbi:MAG: hypothetical protein EOQ89_26315 [Mesorhizobium sp.]|nr:MAG: hypothetical protein EOQ89_26315 [Mesorhizobium sp.]